MFSMKRFGLAALFVIGAGLFTSSLARAQTPLTNSGVDPDATGQATLTDVTSSGFWSFWYSNEGYEIYSGNLTLSCEGLTPGATYRVGPTQVSLSKKDQIIYSYLYVTASDSGTLELATPVRYIGCLWQWVPDPHLDGYWEVVEYYGYKFSVDCKGKRKPYTAVLTGRLW